MVRKSKIVIVFFGAAFLASCSDTPEREKFPGGMGRTTETQRAETQKAVLGGFDPTRTQLPGSQAAPTSNQGANPGPSETVKKIAGTLNLAKGAKLPKSGQLFISARNMEAGGPPVAVKRLPMPASLPFQFELTEKDQMMQGSESFSGVLMITARIDQDGDPLSRQDGDLAGSQNAQVGQTGLKIDLAAPK